MAMNNQANQTDITCWANAAESTRTRAAFKWARIDPKWAAGRSPDEIQRDGWRHRLKPGGEWYRVRVTSDTGKPLLEKIPQSAQYGTPLAGLTNAAFDHIADYFGAAASEFAHGLLQTHAFLHQTLKQLGAFRLRAGKCADAGKPDLLRGFAQRSGHALCMRLCIGILRSGLLCGGFLELGHDALPAGV